ncbi:MAG: glycerophosphodiester phosphodiesterase family protein, partial [Herbinix sp.]|nr:glycerophosphodiester phosphodiesterase family protein [Herbinix sp.]
IHNRRLFLIELTFLVIFLVFILPIINLGLEFTIHLWGQSYITSENVLSYLSYPPAILFVFVMVALISYYLLYQMIAMISFCNSEKDNLKFKITHILFISLIKLKRCTHSNTIPLPFFTVLLFVFLNLPILVYMTLNARASFPGSADLGFTKFLLLLSYTLIALIAFKGMFVVQLFINRRQSFLDAMELSKIMLKDRSLKALRSLIFYNLVLSISCLLVYYFILLLVALFIFLTVENNMAITVFLSIYPRINNILLLFFHVITYLTNVNLITELYNRYREEDSGLIPAHRMNWQTNTLFGKETSYHDLIQSSKLRKHRHILKFFLIFVLAVSLINSYLAIQSDSFYLRNTLSGILVSSHRGNSHVAPENTLPALENAIIAGSDYAEIDVRQTKDGVLVLLHDSSLKRTAGLDKKIETLDLKELSGLDAGSWFGKEFLQTKIPTLEEAIKLCKGKIKLTIEIKAAQKGLLFEENLVALIEKYDFDNLCLICSTDYNTLVKIKQLNPHLRTGLILTATYGNFYDNEAVDFFSIRSRNINRQVVKNAHKAGKEVHAWTVNMTSEIERMKSIGVDCIVTDNPTLTKRVLFQEDTGMSFIDLLNHLLND